MDWPPSTYPSVTLWSGWGFQACDNLRPGECCRLLLSDERNEDLEPLLSNDPWNPYFGDSFYENANWTELQRTDYAFLWSKNELHGHCSGTEVASIWGVTSWDYLSIPPSSPLEILGAYYLRMSGFDGDNLTDFALRAGVNERIRDTANAGDARPDSDHNAPNGLSSDSEPFVTGPSNAIGTPESNRQKGTLSGWVWPNILTLNGTNFTQIGDNTQSRPPITAPAEPAPDVSAYNTCDVEHISLIIKEPAGFFLPITIAAFHLKRFYDAIAYQAANAWSLLPQSSEYSFTKGRIAFAVRVEGGSVISWCMIRKIAMHLSNLVSRGWTGCAGEFFTGRDSGRVFVSGQVSR
ncbi:MAG: hypothetical protein Q9226_007995 [Calogaya cf. arnoldii]